jgi:hypothetical protein
MKSVRFEVLTAVSMKIAVFWVVAPCSLVEVYQRFRGRIALMMEAARTSETLVNFYQTTRCYNSEDSNLRNEVRLHNGVNTIVLICERAVTAVGRYDRDCTAGQYFDFGSGISGHTGCSWPKYENCVMYPEFRQADFNTQLVRLDKTGW